MVERIPLNSIQTAIYTALAADATLDGLGVTVVDYISESQPMPAVVIGAYSQDSNSVKGTAAADVTMTIECWSDTHGMKEVNQIMDAVVQVLTVSTPFVLTGGFSATNGRLVHAEAVVDVDPQGNTVRHGLVDILFHVLAAA